MPSSKALEVLEFMYQRGMHKVTEDTLYTMIDYLEKMIKDKRVWVIKNSLNAPIVVFIFSIGDDPEVFLKKSDWEFRPHDPNGRVIVVEKIIAFDWNKDMRRQIEEQLHKTYPQLDEMNGYRWAKWGDRKFTYRRKSYVRN